jgi:ABC-2 type transport system permease protein
MNGLLKNNFYATLSNAKVFSVVMVLLGAFVAIANYDVLFFAMGYMLLGMVGFPVNSMASIRKESTSKWSKYKLTTPVC